MPRNPVLHEGIAEITSGRRGRRYLGIYLALGSLFTVILWPGNDALYYITFGGVPSTFPVLSSLLLFVNTFIAARFAAGHAAGENTVREWFLMTPLTPSRVLAGKTVSAAVHSVLNAALSLPVLAVAVSPSGLGADRILPALLIIASTAFLVRMTGIFALCVNEESVLLRNLTVWVSVIVLFLFTINLLPAYNPVMVMNALSGVSGAGCREPVIAYLLTAALMCAGSYALLLRRYLVLTREDTP